jgi:hypothetical protein
MFAKVFEQIYDSSIAEDYLVRLVFEDFLVLADLDGVVDMTHEAIARRTNVPIEIVRSAIAKLSMPDPRSRSPKEEGRRLVLLDDHRDWGWQIVNYEDYRNIRDEEGRRTYMREYMRNRRKQAVNPVNSGKPQLAKGEEEEEEENIVGDFTPDGNPLDGLVKAGFSYFLERTGKSPRQYLLSRDKAVMGRRGFEELIKYAKRHQHESPQVAAKQLFEAAVDRLASSEFHNGKNDQGRTYLDWHQLFAGKGYRSPNKLVEFWLDDSKWDGGK